MPSTTRGGVNPGRGANQPPPPGGRGQGGRGQAGGDENPPTLQELAELIQTQAATIAQLQADLAAATAAGAPAPAPATQPRFAATPAEHKSGYLDFDDKNHTILFTKASESLYQDPKDRYNLSPEHTQAFLDKVYDRGVASNLSILMVPEKADDLAGSTKINYCRNHAQFEEKHLQDYVTSIRGNSDRKEQDDRMLHNLLKASLSEAAYKTISIDRSSYTLDGIESGLLMLKYILGQSAVDTTVDPDIVRNELSQATEKFRSVQCNIKTFNEWFMLKVDQLKQNGILDNELHYLKSTLFTAYAATTDPEMATYIGQQKDFQRDNPKQRYDWKELMSRVSKKTDDMAIAATRAQLQGTVPEDPILALQAEVRKQQKTIEKLAKRSKRGSKDNQGGQSSGNSNSNNNGNKKKKSKFPDELKDRSKPDDVNKPVVINGTKYYWCSHHGKWGKHTTSECKKGNGSDTSGSNKDNNDRNGKFIKALSAIHT